MKILVTWCEPFSQACRGERPDARVRPDEIPVALNYFQQTFKQQPTKLFLNRSMIEKLEKAVPEGIEIVEHNGVLSWEIRAEVDDTPNQILGGQETPPNPPDTAPSKEIIPVTPLNQSQSVKTPLRITGAEKTKIASTVTKKPVTKTRVVTGSVTKKAQLALMETLDARIVTLYEAGSDRFEKSSRTIADKLAGEGFNISFMTVNRRIREYLEEKNKGER